MKMVNVHEAKAHLSRLLVEVAAGEEIVIVKAGKPIARIVSVTSGRPERVLGIDAGRVVISDDFDTTLPDGMMPGFDSCRPGVST